MLDEKDLQAIAGLINNALDAKINASEARMKAHVEKAINASEACTLARMEPRAQESEARMLSMMEAWFEPRFNLLGEQIQLIQEKLTPSGALENRVDVVEVVVNQHSREIETLKKAQ